MKKYVGNLEITQDTEIDFEEITGNLVVKNGVKFAAKALKKVGGDLSINAQASLDAPKLETVGGDLYINAQASLDAPKLETVGGYLSIYAQASLPKLETVGGDLSINAQASLDAPKLETVGGDLFINAQASLDAPKLKNKNDATARTKCEVSLAASFKKKGLIKVDGILSWLLSRKRAANFVIFRVKIVGKLKASFVVERGEKFAHGETIKAATESLRYKLADRDTSRFKKWKLTTTVTVEEAIEAYRAITGACEQGVRMFCENKNIPKKLTVARVAELTKGQYGSEKFVGFFQ